MIVTSYLQVRADELLDEGACAVSRAADERVTVELSLELAWLIRDMIGMSHLSHRVRQFAGVEHGYMDDMHRLGAAIPGYRIDDKPSVSRWTKRAAARALDRS